MPDSLSNYVKFLRGTPTAYKNLAKKDNDTLYFVAEVDASTGLLYLGEKLISTGTSEGTLINYLKDLLDVNIENPADKNVLTYDAVTKKWIAKSPEEAVAMKGASDSEDGLEGLVPAPKAGEQEFYLRGDGTWAELPKFNKQIFEAELVDKQTHEEAIESITKDKVVVNGDIVVLKNKIHGDKCEYINYIYNGENWILLNKNYSANNVYFDEDFVFTESVGTVIVPEGAGHIVVDAAGKSVQEFFQELFSGERVNPTITQPSVNINIGLENSYEVGTKIVPTWEAEFNPGNYSYGPETGVVVSSWEITDSENNTASSPIGEFPELTIDENTQYFINIKANHTAGEIPLTNTGIEYPKGQILEGSKEAISKTIVGHRSFFYGLLDISLKNDLSIINSELIRNNLNNEPYKKGLKINVAAYEGAKSLVLAIPSNVEEYESATMPSVFYLNIPWVANSPYIVSVEGANNYNAIDYKVWVYEPAALDASETYEIIL